MSELMMSLECVTVLLIHLNGFSAYTLSIVKSVKVHSNTVIAYLVPYGKRCGNAMDRSYKRISLVQKHSERPREVPASYRTLGWP